MAILGIFIHVVCNALSFYNRRPTAVGASTLLVFFIRNALYRKDYRLNINRSLWEPRQASPFKVRRRSDTRLVLLKLIVACVWRIHTASFDVHTPFVSFVFTVLRISVRFERSVKRGPKTGLTRIHTFHGPFNDKLSPLWHFGRLILLDYFILFLSVRWRNIVRTYPQLDIATCRVVLEIIFDSCECNLNIKRNRENIILNK